MLLLCSLAFGGDISETGSSKATVTISLSATLVDGEQIVEEEKSLADTETNMTNGSHELNYTVYDWLNKLYTEDKK
jgi:hypothetical protein